MSIAPDGLEAFAELPGEQWTPSNSDSGAAFLDDWCSNCERDKVLNGTVQFGKEQDGDLCEIVGASYRGEAKEWREIDGEIKCISFVRVGERLPDRCPNTPDMFAA